MSSAAETRLYGFDWLRAAAVIAVVGIHVTDVVFRRNDYFPRMSAEGVAYYAAAACLRFCVPAFFMMSAFLLETRVLAGGPKPSARWQRYLLPLVVATIFYTLLNVAIASALKKPIDPLELLVLAICGQAAVHTWFLLNVLIYALCYDALRVLAADRVFPFVAASYSLLFALTLGRIPLPSNPGTSALTNVVLGVPYYVAGIWAARHASQLQSLSRAPTLLALGLGLLLSTVYGVVLHERGFYNLGAELWASALFLNALQTKTPPLRAFSRIAAYSLGIYLWHLFVLTVVRVAEGRLYREVVSAEVTLAIVLVEVGLGLAGGLLIAVLLGRIRGLKGLAQ